MALASGACGSGAGSGVGRGVRDHERPGPCGVRTGYDLRVYRKIDAARPNILPFRSSKLSQRMLSKDLLYAFRTLKKSPVFAVTSVVTIGLGIGGSTAIFRVTDAVLLRSLPYKDPDRLVLACSDMRRRNVKDFPLSNADFLDLRNGAKRTFEDFAAVNTFRFPLLASDGRPEQVRGAAVFTNFFRLMGVQIAFGRDFQDADGLPQPPPPAPGGAAPGGPPPQRLPVYTMFSFEYFQRRFGGNRALIGQPLPVTG